MHTESFKSKSLQIIEIRGQSGGMILNSNAQRGTHEISTWCFIMSINVIISQDMRKERRCRAGLATLRKDSLSFEMRQAHILLPYLADCVHRRLLQFKVLSPTAPYPLFLRWESTSLWSTFVLFFPKCPGTIGPWELSFGFKPG